MYEIFFNPRVMTLWIAIHSMSFVALKFRQWERPLSILAFAALQFYFFVILNVLKAPFIPTAPVFFLISTVVLVSYSNGSLTWMGATWFFSWLTANLWIKTALGTPSFLSMATSIAMVVNIAFMACFAFVSRYYANRLAKHIALLGPQARYDDYRIQASKMQTLGELTASIAHEIANPLAAIMGYSHQIKGELGAKGSLSVEHITQANDRIKFNIDRIGDITKALRVFARDSTKDEYVPVSVRDIIEDSLMLVRHTVKEVGIEMEVEWPVEDAFVKGSLVQLSQLVVNLLTNARDACLSSERKKITVGYASESGHVVLWVADTGPGIQEKIAKDIYRPFFTTKDVGKGTGLGLHIAKTIAERHGARLEYVCPRDPAGRVLGTRFTMTLERLEPQGGEGEDSGSASAA
jgi:signal transduction histidine kinase